MVPAEAVRDLLKNMIKKVHSDGHEEAVVFLHRRLRRAASIARCLEEEGFSAEKKGGAWEWTYSLRRDE